MDPPPACQADATDPLDVVIVGRTIAARVDHRWSIV